VVVAALPLGAGTIDVSSTTTAVLHSGESLRFEVLTWNFSTLAAGLGVPEYPTEVGFVFVSAPTDSTGWFEAALGSGDGSVSAAFGGPLSFAPALFQSSRYSGTVSTLQGSLHLSETLSQQLFAGSAAVLMLRNTGADVTVGLPPYTLGQDLTVSLSGGPLSVGALRGGVTLESVPEPRSGALLLGAGALLCLLSRVLKRVFNRLQSGPAL
jgi:hypothetical protein